MNAVWVRAKSQRHLYDTGWTEALRVKTLTAVNVICEKSHGVTCVWYELNTRSASRKLVSSKDHQSQGQEPASPFWYGLTVALPDECIDGYLSQSQEPASPVWFGLNTSQARRKLGSSEASKWLSTEQQPGIRTVKGKLQREGNL